MKGVVVVPGGGSYSGAHVIGCCGPGRGVEKEPPIITVIVHCQDRRVDASEA
ncbi:hypothetical protein FIBSPDRAFT_869175 [Athelia psychrophila]|uniref:Uncharacterized protein n=1 Tax=Athelia psychrophila TaxID=1759441 RepID=A0A166CCL5_9AGAM|nr:hypothetical protein FIBSPDRAFT_869175 [Fibularhizoctonia sp. CBS 109695]